MKHLKYFLTGAIPIVIYIYLIVFSPDWFLVGFILAVLAIASYGLGYAFWNRGDSFPEPRNPR